MRVAVEVCVTSVAEAVAAERGGADTVEVCSWLACGGITPSWGLVDAVRAAVRIPVRVLVRPTSEGFVYGAAERHALMADAGILGHRSFGLVTGALSAEGHMDRQLMASIAHSAPGSELTFHRAVDHARDPVEVLDGCMTLGVDRLLTSGGAARAQDGAGVLRRLVDRAGAYCTIAAAGGINAENVVGIVERAGVREIHFAAQRAVPAHGVAVPLISAPADGAYTFVPDEAKIQAVMNALVKAGLR
jgi:copper homeostasis protein